MPEYVATKSAWKAVTPLRVLFFWLILPLFAIIFEIIYLKHVRIEFYNDKIIMKSGIFTKHERRSMFNGVMSVSVTQSLLGRMFNYGDISVDVVGQWDIDTKGIKDPHGLQNYLNRKIGLVKNANTVIMA